MNGAPPVVLANDAVELTTLRLDDFDNIVISPGPGRPQNPRDVGFVGELLSRTSLPVLGVCLGHQFLGHDGGAVVGFAPEPKHGHLTQVTHQGDAMFAGIPSTFVAVRYHSLRVEEPLPAHLIPTAWSEDGVLMALKHRDLPRWGVQFHPESIASQFGFELMVNFRELTRERALRSATPTAAPTPGQVTPRPRPAVVRPIGSSPLQLISTVVPTAIDTEAGFMELFEYSPTCFWLDSSRVEAGLSRFSFLGDASGPLGEVLSYRVADAGVTVSDAVGTHTEPGTIFDVLNGRLSQRYMDDPRLPFDLCGGYVGYFGYELKADCGSVNRHVASTPDAVWMFAGRLIAVDHETGLTYVLAVHDGGDAQRAQAEEWVDRTAVRLLDLLPTPATSEADEQNAELDPLGSLIVDQRQYEANIDECKRQLRLGESYEICLTNKMRLPFRDDDVAFYRRLRKLNPAPYGALIRVDDMAILSSSPERFLRIERDGLVESKPIKGTAARSLDPVIDARLARELAASPKTQAENLMIVDLLRNDLGQVCEVGSVKVDAYMSVESYATVHQLVSTIQGSLNPEISPVDCVQHCFPGGSMTGAPKLRTMAIIDELETEARGVYSGALGYFGLSGGADLNIVIRTAVRHGDELTIGAGGAIVLNSDTREEFDEMMLKASASLSAFRVPTPSESSQQG